MSTLQSPGTCIVSRTARPEHFHPTASLSVSPGDSATPAMMDKASSVMQDAFGEQFRLAGIAISQEESQELRVFDEFLAYHVEPNGICSVQCMLLWNEWVRTFRHLTHGFPKLILEKEFCSVIADKFGVKSVDDGFRGTVFPGIRFVP